MFFVSFDTPLDTKRVTIRIFRDTQQPTVSLASPVTAELEMLPLSVLGHRPIDPFTQRWVYQQQQRVENEVAIRSLQLGDRYVFCVDDCVIFCDPLAFVLNNDFTGTPTAVFCPQSSPCPLIVATPKRRIQDLIIYEMWLGGVVPERNENLGEERLTTPCRLEHLGDTFFKHIVSLGFNAVQLLPLHVNKAECRWGYGPLQLAALDERFGTPDHFRNFLASARRHDVDVFIDFVCNHVSSEDLLPPWMFGDDNDMYQKASRFGPRLAIDRACVFDYILGSLNMWLTQFPDLSGVRVDSPATLLSLKHVKGSLPITRHENNLSIAAVNLLVAIKKLCEGHGKLVIYEFAPSTDWKYGDTVCGSRDFDQVQRDRLSESFDACWLHPWRLTKHGELLSVGGQSVKQKLIQLMLAGSKRRVVYLQSHDVHDCPVDAAKGAESLSLTLPLLLLCCPNAALLVLQGSPEKGTALCGTEHFPHNPKYSDVQACKRLDWSACSDKQLAPWRTLMKELLPVRQALQTQTSSEDGTFSDLDSFHIESGVVTFAIARGRVVFVLNLSQDTREEGWIVRASHVGNKFSLWGRWRIVMSCFHVLQRMARVVEVSATQTIAIEYLEKRTCVVLIRQDERHHHDG